MRALRALILVLLALGVPAEVGNALAQGDVFMSDDGGAGGDCYGRLADFLAERASHPKQKPDSWTYCCDNAHSRIRPCSPSPNKGKNTGCCVGAPAPGLQVSKPSKAPLSGSVQAVGGGTKPTLKPLKPPKQQVAQRGDVFMNDDTGRPGSGSGMTACQADCVETFGNCVGGIQCNYDLEICVHECGCKVNPDCGPTPHHRETDDGGPPPAPSTGGAKGLVRTVADCAPDGAKGIFRKGCEEVLRRDCDEAGAKGLVRKHCQELHRKDCAEAGAKGLHRAGCEDVFAADCAEDGAKGIIRKGCEEVLRKDCIEAGSKGLLRKDCQELHRRDCTDAAAKGIHRKDCDETQTAKTDCGPDPVVSVPQLTQAMDACLQDAVRWYMPPELVVSPGAAAFHDPGASTITYDPAVLESRSLYEKVFLLADAYGGYVADLEMRRFETVRSPEERYHIAQSVAGHIGRCLWKAHLLPKQEGHCYNIILAHSDFSEAQARGITRTGSAEMTPMQQAGYEGWNIGFNFDVPQTIWHWPTDAAIVEVQNALNTLGYDAGPADGIWGRQTMSALVRFNVVRTPVREIWPAYPSDQALQQLVDEMEKRGVPMDNTRDYLTLFPHPSPGTP